MPLEGNVRYRWKKTKKGKVRLAFRNNKVIEVKKKGGKAKMVNNPHRKKKRGYPLVKDTFSKSVLGA